MMRIRRLLRYEFWPFWVFYFPTYFYWGLLAFLAKRTTYFTAANPMMNNGGAVNVPKSSYLSQLPKEWIPETYVVEKEGNILSELPPIAAHDFPMILKPDCGERGKGVVFVRTLKHLGECLQTLHNGRYLLQAYCDYPQETGILYCKFPSQERGTILSITTKAFCRVIGDGKHTWGQLIEQQVRVAHRLGDLKQVWASDWDRLSEPNKTLLVEPIGSHNRGTKFMDGRDQISNALTAQVNHWANQLPGFYFGRFDIKFQSWNELTQGNAFKMIEINGVNAEPTHIYDPGYSIFQAYRDIFSQMKIIYEISCENLQLGIRPKSLIPFLIELIQAARR